MVRVLENNKREVSNFLKKYSNKIGSDKPLSETILFKNTVPPSYERLINIQKIKES